MDAARRAADAVIFDCDGLLLDTETLWSGIERDWCAANGVPYGAEVKHALIGTTPLGTAEILAGLSGRVNDAVQILDELDGMERARSAQGIDAMPGARELVDVVAARVPVYVASNGGPESLPRHLAAAGFADLVDLCVGQADVARGKPAPDLYLEAARRVGVAPGRCAAIEDSATGMASAREAGMYVIAVPTLPGEYQADWRVESLADPELVAWARSLGASS